MEDPQNDLCNACGEAALSAWNDFLLSERERLAKEIRDRRRELGMTQEELAKKTDLKQSSIARIESARFYPSSKILHKIANALDARLAIVPETTTEITTKKP